MTKRHPSTSVTTRQKPTRDPELDAELRRVLKDLQSKVMKSPALNGGFDTLMLKIEGIEKGQDHLVDRVDSIYEAVYNPDTGLFSRLKSVEQWRGVEEKTADKEQQVNVEQNEIVRVHAAQLKDLSRFKDRTSAIVKWVVITLATGGTGLLGKLAYDLATRHIQFI